MLELRQVGGSARFQVLFLVFCGGIWAFWELDLDPSRLVPGRAGLGITLEFFSSALSPALTYQAESVPPGAPPLLLKALKAAGTTVLFAAAAMSLALVLGLLLGFSSSSAWWKGEFSGTKSLLPWRRGIRGSALAALYGFSRLLIALMRSIHELLWAVLFLAAFGLTHLSAIAAIAIPYGGTLAKVFSELIDEAPRDTAEALRSTGASPLQVFFFGLFPRALPDMTAYTLYRFECSLRASAVLGFFGFPTLGFYLSASFENLYYGEVWTYLYTLFALILVMDWWSGAIRRRFVA